MFQIDVKNLTWLSGTEDDPHDLCLHGHATAVIGGTVLEYTAAVSATALQLLKSLTEDHVPGNPPDSQMLPCCGHSLIPNDNLSEVYICGCPNGIDWTVRHEGKHVRLVLENGQETLVPLDAYKAEVFRFADQIQSFYAACAPKILPEKADDLDRLGYTAFWNEWHRRRGK